MRDGAFVFCEHPVHFARELRLEVRYVVATAEDTVPMGPIIGNRDFLDGSRRAIFCNGDGR